MACTGRFFAVLISLCATAAATAQSQAADATAPNGYAVADQIFDEFRLDAHIPGLVYGIVADGHLVHVRSFGVQDNESARPVTPDTLFRVASMTKAFTALTILKLRDDGRLRLARRRSRRAKAHHQGHENPAGAGHACLPSFCRGPPV